MKDFLKKVYSDFVTQEENWCEIAYSQFVPNGLSNKIYGGYEREHFQQFYLLKYAPSYLEEYVEIYEVFLKNYIKNTLRVLSVGVGAGLDYSGLVYALKKRDDIEMEYLGIDLVDWKYRDREISFEQVDLKDIAKNIKVMNFIKKGVDVIIFPKSIIEIPINSFGNDAFSELCDALVKNNIDDIWFLNSYIKKYNEVSGLDEFSFMLVKMYEEGYALVGGSGSAKYYESNQRNTYYPIDYRNTWQRDLDNHCNERCSETQSVICRLAQYPMLKKSHIAYGVTNLRKVA